MVKYTARGLINSNGEVLEVTMEGIDICNIKTACYGADVHVFILYEKKTSIHSIPIGVYTKIHPDDDWVGNGYTFEPIDKRIPEDAKQKIKSINKISKDLLRL